MKREMDTRKACSENSLLELAKGSRYPCDTYIATAPNTTSEVDTKPSGIDAPETKSFVTEDTAEMSEIKRHLLDMKYLYAENENVISMLFDELLFYCDGNFRNLKNHSNEPELKRKVDSLHNTSFTASILEIYRLYLSTLPIKEHEKEVQPIGLNFGLTFERSPGLDLAVSRAVLVPVGKIVSSSTSNIGVMMDSVKTAVNSSTCATSKSRVKLAPASTRNSSARCNLKTNQISSPTPETVSALKDGALILPSSSEVCSSPKSKAETVSTSNTVLVSEDGTLTSSISSCSSYNSAKSTVRHIPRLTDPDSTPEDWFEISSNSSHNSYTLPDLVGSSSSKNTNADSTSNLPTVKSSDVFSVTKENVIKSPNSHYSSNLDLFSDLNLPPIIFNETGNEEFENMEEESYEIIQSLFALKLTLQEMGSVFREGSGNDPEDHQKDSIKNQQSSSEKMEVTNSDIPDYNRIHTKRTVSVPSDGEHKAKVSADFSYRNTNLNHSSKKKRKRKNYRKRK